MRSSRHLFLWCGLLGSLVLFVFAWTAALGQDATLVPIDITASYIVQGATLFRETEIVLTLGGTPTATLPFSATQFNPMPTDATLASRGLTQQAIAQSTPPITIISPPIDRTATAIIQRATDEAPPTEVPLTNAEKEELQRRWVSEMETAFGFAHPIFDYIASEIISQSYLFGGSDILRTFRLRFHIHRTAFENDEYIAGVIPFPPDAVLIFQIKPGGDVFLLNDVFPGFSWYTGLDDFADRNGNGYPDILVGGYMGGNCGRRPLRIWEIRPGGILVDLSADWVSTRGTETQDLNGDGVLEFMENRVTTDIPGGYSPCGYPVVHHWYGWDGAQYVDISATLDESYYPRIAAFWADEAHQSGCLLPDAEMYLLLLDYEVLGRLEEGWARLAPTLRWESCPAQTLIDQGETMGAFLTWVGEHRRNQAYAH